MNSREKMAERFLDLVDIMARLRSDTGCPWDRKQNHQSLKRYLLEETYELLEAIDTGPTDAICDELGDVFLQLVFHAQIAREAGLFDAGDSLDSICKKLRHRHPHVFGSEKASTPEDVLVIWHRQKAMEQAPGEDNSILGNVPHAMPALARAQALQRKAAKVGFDWPKASGAIEKLLEEIQELRKAEEEGCHAASEEEIGDIFFSLVNVCRFLKIEAEDAARKATLKFERRFNKLESLAAAKGLNFKELTLSEMDGLWDQVKRMENSAETDT